MNAKKNKAARAMARALVAGQGEAELKAIAIAKRAVPMTAKAVRRAVRIAIRESQSATPVPAAGESSGT